LPDVFSPTGALRPAEPTRRAPFYLFDVDLKCSHLVTLVSALSPAIMGSLMRRRLVERSAFNFVLMWP
jgi:hypothetical protein